MMKKILMVAVASTAFLSSTAFAQSQDSQDLAFNATVLPECSLENPTDVTFASVNINQGAGSSALLLKNGSQVAPAENIYVSCNYATTLSVTSDNDGLTNATGAAVAANDPLDFTNVIHYRVELKSTDGSFPLLDFRTVQGAATKTVNAAGAFHDDAALKVYIDRDDTSKRPVAGDYSDRAVITIGAV
ncbi:hypothetical protein [Parasphingorhabdus sp.]|uniref:hypothetical protein n=1 Tax=Parasphingorhabdus sp. TaxID=2709688 RepID=UPI003002F260